VRSQDGVAEPAVGDVAVGAAGASWTAGVVVALGAALGAVVRVRRSGFRVSSSPWRSGPAWRVVSEDLPADLPAAFRFSAVAMLG
jgi:hypothetical protein